MKTYKQKDLGYKRAKTKALFHIKMEDGSTWAVPVQLIADNRDEYYFMQHKDEEDIIQYIRDGYMGEYDIEDWAANNMDWKDVAEYAEKVESSECVDFQEGWVNGVKEIVGEI